MIHRRPGPVRQQAGEASDVFQRRGAYRYVAENRTRTPSAVSAGDAARAVQHQHVKADGIARLHLPAENSIFVERGVDIGQIGQRTFRKPLRFGVHEGTRHQPRSQMRSGHELQCGFSVHRIDRNPKTHVLPALDIVIRLILMPGRDLPSMSFLGEHVVVVQTRSAAVHELRGGLGQGRGEDQAALVRIVRQPQKSPTAPWIARRAGDDGARTQGGKVLIVPSAACRFVRPEQLAYADRAARYCSTVSITMRAVPKFLQQCRPRYAKPVYTCNGLPRRKVSRARFRDDAAPMMWKAALSSARNCDMSFMDKDATVPLNPLRCGSAGGERAGKLPRQQAITPSSCTERTSCASAEPALNSSRRHFDQQRHRLPMRCCKVRRSSSSVPRMRCSPSRACSSRKRSVLGEETFTAM